ncbi:7,8-dihydro-6-hydroxymethylpterin-pyrophosphokinase, putative [Verrucomicrobiia bacterium DG1235]|nr:7,8-dihydro-6-hydroxymethylpterin-pyrophosphokinase, putative [Verrucomicrobiae bacterium DG1235]
MGSNLGCKVGNIRRAVSFLKEMDGIQNVELSSFYKTEPVGKTDQDWFVNAVARLETSLSARELLDACLEIERKLKRVRDERWGPRTLDIDILLFGESRIEEESLQVPHPRIRERAFVLKPLLELDADLEWAGVRYGDSLNSVRSQGIERMESVVAILGASDKPERYANMAQRFLVEKGHQVALVAPRGESILGVAVDRRVEECNSPVDTVTLYIGSARVGGVVEGLLQVMPRRVIFNPGTENATVREALEAAGIETLEACTLVMLRTGQF